MNLQYFSVQFYIALLNLCFNNCVMKYSNHSCWVCSASFFNRQNSGSIQRCGKILQFKYFVRQLSYSHELLLRTTCDVT